METTPRYLRQHFLNCSSVSKFLEGPWGNGHSILHDWQEKQKHKLRKMAPQYFPSFKTSLDETCAVKVGNVSSCHKTMQCLQTENFRLLRYEKHQQTNEKKNYHKPPAAASSAKMSSLGAVVADFFFLAPLGLLGISLKMSPESPNRSSSPSGFTTFLTLRVSAFFTENNSSSSSYKRTR